MLLRSWARLRPSISAASLSGVPRSLVVRTQLESGVDICWRVSADDLQKIDPPDSGLVVSFSRFDHRFTVAHPLSAERAKSFAVRESESDERMRVVNLTRRHRRLYAAPESRLNNLSYRTAPGAQVLDAIIEARGLEAAPAVVGMIASAKDSSQRLLVLQAVSVTGHVEVAVSVNPDDIDQAVALFMSATRLPDECPRLIISAREFLEGAQGLMAYPSEPEWQGISIRTIAVVSIVFAIAAACASAGLAMFHYLKAQTASAQSLDAQTQSLAVERRIGVLMSSAPVTIAQEMSLPIDKIFERAEQMWVPGALVSFHASRSSVDYKITIPLPNTGKVRAPAFGSSSETNLDQINKALELQSPEGCVRRENSTTGLANEVQVAISCQDSRPRLSL